MKPTTTAVKIDGFRKRVRIVQGGSSAGKTYAILSLLYSFAADEKQGPYEISVVAESIPHLRCGALKDFLKMLRFTGLYQEDLYNRTLLRYEFPHGSYIEFFSADQSDKMRGARRDVLFVNEANNITWESYHQLAIRTRQAIYIDFNPVSEFWAHTELMYDSDAEFLLVTYKDNEALDPAIIKEIEKAKDKAATSTYWANWWKVYGLGEVGSLQGVVFDDWKQVDGIDFAGDKLMGIGLDWGYTNDPTAVVAVYRRDKSLVLHELLYQTGLTNQDIAEQLRKLGINRAWPIIADSAEPKSIEEVHRLGFNIHPATKGQDSIRNNIDFESYHQLAIRTSDSIYIDFNPV